MNNTSLKTYTWSGITMNGKKIKGEIQSLNFNHAKILLTQKGITYLRIRKKPIRFFLAYKQNISQLDIAIFFRQLATLLTAGISIVSACDILFHSQEKMALRQLIGVLKNNMESGKTLVSGLNHFPHYFDSLSCHLVYAGEQTGTLNIMLHRIAKHKEKSLALKNKIQQALFYPSILFSVALLVTVCMLTFVVPHFAELFQSSHVKLPAFTNAILILSRFLKQYSWLWISPIISIYFLIYFLKTSPIFKNHIDHILLTLPIINNLIKKSALLRFSKNLAITTSAGMPLIQSLKIIANTMGNYDYTKAVQTLITKIANGQQLYASMQQNSLFLPMTIQMIKIGEESGTLTHMLEKIAEIYEADIDYVIVNSSHLLEPLIIIILGVLIGGLVIAMYLPIFKLGKAF